MWEQILFSYTVMYIVLFLQYAFRRLYNKGKIIGSIAFGAIVSYAGLYFKQIQLPLTLISTISIGVIIYYMHKGKCDVRIQC